MIEGWFPVYFPVGLFKLIGVLLEKEVVDCFGTLGEIGATTFGLTDLGVRSDCPTNGIIVTGSVRDFFFQPHFSRNIIASNLFQPRVFDFWQIYTQHQLYSKLLVNEV